MWPPSTPSLWAIFSFAPGVSCSDHIFLSFQFKLTLSFAGGSQGFLGDGDWRRKGSGFCGMGRLLVGIRTHVSGLEKLPQGGVVAADLKVPVRGCVRGPVEGRKASGLFLVAVSGLSSVVALCGLLFAVASLVATPRLQRTGPEVVVHGLSCPTPCGIFPDHELNLCLLHR